MASFTYPYQLQYLLLFKIISWPYAFILTEIFTGFRTFNMNENRTILKERESAMADMKFTYVVSCQLYGAQKKSSDEGDHSRYSNILDLMLT